MMEVQVMQDILGKNDRIAAENQALFADKKIFALKLMGSPGSGKTVFGGLVVLRSGNDDDVAAPMAEQRVDGHRPSADVVAGHRAVVGVG